MEDSADSDCELVIDETIFTTEGDRTNNGIPVESIQEDNWQLFHPKSISSSDIKDELFSDETNTCTICNETFRYNIGLIYHLEMEHVELNLQSQINERTNMKKRKCPTKTGSNSVQGDACLKQVMNVSKKVSCDVCRKSFANQCKLMRHTETCSMKYSCVFCKSKFIWESKYKKHLFKVHKFNAVVICKYCSNVFGDMNALAVHELNCDRGGSSPVNQLPQQS